MLLALDTASPTVSVALHDGSRGGPGGPGPGGSGVVAEASSTRTMKHGEELAPLIAQVLAEAGVERRELTRVVVGVGPGPFTGLRVGLVTARTIGHVLGIAVDGVCSLDALALEAVATGSVEGPFAVATDARRKEVYLARYDADATRVGDPVVVKPAGVATEGPVVGEGAALYPEALPDGRSPLRPAAGWLARGVAEGRVVVLAPEPLYLRRPDAEAR